MVSDPNEFDVKAEHIYEANKEEWVKVYGGKIIAIDVDVGDCVSVGDQARDVGLKAREERPGNRIYMRRVGKNPAVARL